MSRFSFQFELKEVSLKELLLGGDRIRFAPESILVPPFQRDYVWTSKDVVDFYDSIYKGYPIGILIFWFPKDIEEIGSRPLIYSESSSYKYYIFDGQQRLTSLLALVKNFVIPIGDNEKIELEPVYFNPENQEFSNRKVGVRLDKILKAFWFPDEYSQYLLELKENYSEHHFKLFKYLAERFEYYKIPIHIIDTSELDNENVYNSIAEAFIRINTAGRKISKSDLIISFLALAISDRGFKLKLKEIYKSIDDNFQISIRPLIRTYLAIKDIPQGTQGKRLIERLETTEEDLTDLELLKQAIMFSINILKSFLGNDREKSKILPSESPLVPIFYWAYKVNSLENLNLILKDEENLSEIRKTIIEWLIISYIKNIFNEGTNKKLNEAIEIINNSVSHANWKFPLEELIRKFLKGRKISKFDLEQFLNMNNAKWKNTGIFLLYTLLVENEATDLAGRLIKDIKMENLEIHHLNSIKCLREKMDDNSISRRDAIVSNLYNLTIINKSINREIGDGCIQDYYSKYPALAKHFIPVDHEISDNETYKEFLQKRLEVVWEFLKAKFPNIVEY